MRKSKPPTGYPMPTPRAAAACSGAGVALVACCTRASEAPSGPSVNFVPGTLGAAKPKGRWVGAQGHANADPVAVRVSTPSEARSSGVVWAPLLAGSAVGLQTAVKARARASRRRGLRTSSSGNGRPKRTACRFFNTTLEDLNPFKEAPQETTRKRYQPRVDEINALESTFKGCSDDELRKATAELQEKAKAGESLDSLLPKAFAIVREASSRVLGLRHFDVQLMGGMALHEGNIAEMGTGEGKTLVAILPAFLNALPGSGTHVVTVNDYLARRDAEWVGQPLRFLGMNVGVVQGGMEPEQRRKAYQCDVTYVTNSELGFDYLRDQLAQSQNDLCLRAREPFQFAVVDEVDSILIDEARTPLIISGQADQPGRKYQIAREVARTLRKTVHYEVDEKQKQCLLIEGGVEAAERLVGKDDLFDPQDPWFPFIVNALNAKELYLRDKSYIVKKGEVMIVDEFTGRIMEGRRWSNGLHQAVEAKENVPIQAESVTLASISYQSLFRLFKKLSGMTGTANTEAKEFKEIYKLETAVLPPNREKKRADKDDQVFVDDIGKWKGLAREIENAHRIGRPVLVGTTNVENSEIVAELLDALGVPYRLLNAKPENVARETEIVAASGRKYAVTIATNMAGRGTDILLGGNSSMMARMRLREELFALLFPERAMLWRMPEDFYPVDLSPLSEATLRGAVKYAAREWLPKTNEKPTSLESAARIVDAQITELDAEERLSLACEKAPIETEALVQLRKAYQTLAAEYGEVTSLEKREIIALGGLYVLGTERHESRRIDNQLRGRCARQGDPGATRFYLSLNDTIFRIFGGESIKKMMNMVSFSSSEDTALESGLLSTSLEEAQKKVENYFYSVRKSVFDYDDVMDTQRQIVYGLRRKALLDNDDTIKETMFEFSDKNMDDFVEGHINVAKPVDEWILGKLAENVGIYCDAMKPAITEESLKAAAGSGGPDGVQAVAKLLKAEAREALHAKYTLVEEQGIGLSGMVQRQILLQQLDSFWQQHLKNMDFLKTSVTLRAYGQKQPLTEYKLDGYQIFLKMMSRIRRNAVYNMNLFMPRKLTPMSEERIKAFMPTRKQRRQEVTPALEKAAKSQNARKAALKASRTVDLARLALSVRQLLQARESLQELALASFSELQNTFERAGLATPGDQVKWAAACTDFELLEDKVAGELYIGLKSRGASAGPPPTGAEVEGLAVAQDQLQAALANPDLMDSIGEMAANPAMFLEQMKDVTGQEGWSADDVSKMRDMYRAAGVDIDETLRLMSESSDDLPEGQKEIVAYMQSLLAKSAEAPSTITAEDEKMKV